MTIFMKNIAMAFKLLSFSADIRFDDLETRNRSIEKGSKGSRIRGFKWKKEAERLIVNGEFKKLRIEN